MVTSRLERSASPAKRLQRLAGALAADLRRVREDLLDGPNCSIS
jgi:hypothetical protein